LESYRQKQTKRERKEDQLEVPSTPRKRGLSPPSKKRRTLRVMEANPMGKQVKKTIPENSGKKSSREEILAVGKLGKAILRENYNGGPRGGKYRLEYHASKTYSKTTGISKGGEKVCLAKEAKPRVGGRGAHNHNGREKRKIHRTTGSLSWLRKTLSSLWGKSRSRGGGFFVEYARQKWTSEKKKNCRLKRQPSRAR